MPILQEIVSITLISLSLLAVFSVFEALSRKYTWNTEEMRRISHVAGALFGLAIAVFFSKVIFIVAALLMAALMAISHKKSVFRHIHAVSRKTYGEELLSLGLLGAYLFSNAEPSIFVPAFLITGISDPINGFVVNKTKDRRLGFLCFVASTAVILLIFTSLDVFTVLKVALLMGGIEQLFSYGTDNLMLPIAAALVLLWLL